MKSYKKDSRFVIYGYFTEIYVQNSQYVRNLRKKTCERSGQTHDEIGPYKIIIYEGISGSDHMGGGEMTSVSVIEVGTMYV
jgi:hypothetical protein